MSATRYIEPTRATRLKFAAVRAAPALCLIVNAYWIAPAMRRASPCDALPWMRLVLIIFLVAPLSLGISLLRKAVRTWRLQQTPLPDAWIWRRTPVATGWRARLEAVLAGVIAVPLLVGPPYLLIRYELYYLFAFWLPCAESARCLGLGT